MDRDTWIALGLAVIFTIVYFFTFTTSFDNPSEWRYASIAKGIWDYGAPLLVEFNFFTHPPLFPYVIAFFYLFTHHFVQATQVAVLMFAFLSVFFIYKLGRFFFDEKYSIALTVASAVSYGFMWNATRAMMEISVMFFFTAGVYFFLKFTKAPTQKNLIFLSIILGLGILTKSPLYILAFVTFIFIVLFLRKSLSFSDFAQKIAIVILIPLIINLPNLVYRYLNHANLFVDQSLTDIVLLGGGFYTPFLFALQGNYLFFVLHIFEIIHPVILFFAILGLIFAVRNKELSKFSFILALIFVMFGIQSFASYAEIRYLFHLIPLITLFGIYGVQNALHKFASNKFLLEKFVLILICGLVLVSTFFTLPPSNDRILDWQVWKELKPLVGNEIVGMWSDRYYAPYVISGVYSVPILDDQNFSHMFSLHYVLLPLRDYSTAFRVQLNLIQSWADCNCGLYAVTSDLSKFTSLRAVDETGVLLSRVVMQQYSANFNFLNSALTNGFDDAFGTNTEILRKRSPYTMSQLAILGHVLESSGVSPLVEFTSYSQSDSNGILLLKYTQSWANKETTESAFFTQGILFISRVCYEPQEIPIRFVAINGNVSIAACNDAFTVCHTIKTIQLKKSNCWFNSQSTLIQ